MFEIFLAGVFVVSLLFRTFVWRSRSSEPAETPTLDGVSYRKARGLSPGGRMYDQRLAKLQAVLMIVGVLVTFGVMLITGALGLPRRYASYPAEFVRLMQVTTVGAYVIGVSVLMWVVNTLKFYWSDSRVREADVWNLKVVGQFTREWQRFKERLEIRYATDGGGSEENI